MQYSLLQFIISIFFYL